MKIKDNIYNFSFKFLDYEFDTFTNESDIYDLNWLKCRFEFTFKGTYLSIDDASMTTFDVLNFVAAIENILMTNEYKDVELQNLEPDFILRFSSNYTGYRIYIHYNFYVDESFESIDLELSKIYLSCFVSFSKIPRLYVLPSSIINNLSTGI